MNFNKVIAERRSVRKYDKDKKIEKSAVEELIKAANLAPSWKNKQTSRYHVVMSENKRAILKKCMHERNAMNQHNKILTSIFTTSNKFFYNFIKLIFLIIKNSMTTIFKLYQLRIFYALMLCFS